MLGSFPARSCGAKSTQGKCHISAAPKEITATLRSTCSCWHQHSSSTTRSDGPVEKCKFYRTCSVCCALVLWGYRCCNDILGGIRLDHMGNVSFPVGGFPVWFGILSPHTCRVESRAVEQPQEPIDDEHQTFSAMQLVRRHIRLLQAGLWKISINRVRWWAFIVEIIAMR